MLLEVEVEAIRVEAVDGDGQKWATLVQRRGRTDEAMVELAFEQLLTVAGDRHVTVTCAPLFEAVPGLDASIEAAVMRRQPRPIVGP